MHLIITLLTWMIIFAVAAYLFYATVMAFQKIGQMVQKQVDKIAEVERMQYNERDKK